MPFAQLSVVVARLKKIYPVITDQVNDTVFLGETAGPDAGGEVLQRLRQIYASILTCFSLSN